jgi:hypothetical protein
MNAASFGIKVKPKLRVVTIPVVLWSAVISVVVITVPHIVAMVCSRPIVPVTFYVVVSLNRAIAATPCLRWRRQSHQKHCQKNGYHNFTDVFHFYPPFILY